MTDYFVDLRFIRAQLRKHQSWLEGRMKGRTVRHSSDFEQEIILTSPNDITMWRILRGWESLPWIIMRNPKYDFATRLYLCEKLTSSPITIDILQYATECLTLVDVKQIVSIYPDTYPIIFSRLSHNKSMSADAYEYLHDNYGYDMGPYLNHQFGDASMPLPNIYPDQCRTSLSNDIDRWLPALDTSNCDRRAIDHDTVEKYDIISATPKEIIRRMHSKFGPYDSCKCQARNMYRWHIEWSHISNGCRHSIEKNMPYERIEFGKKCKHHMRVTHEYRTHYHATLIRAIHRFTHDWQEISSSPGGVHYHSCMHDM